jgi:hypothetical protein
MGPAVDHLRAFEVWVPSSSALRITNTVWWFLENLWPDDSLLQTDRTSSPPFHPPGIVPTPGMMGPISSGATSWNRSSACV